MVSHKKKSFYRTFTLLLLNLRISIHIRLPSYDDIFQDNNG